MLWNTSTPIKLHSEWYMVVPRDWQKPDITSCDWWDQLVVHNCITVLIGVKYLIIETKISWTQVDTSQNLERLINVNESKRGLCIHRNFKGLSDYDKISRIRNDANILSNKNVVFTSKTNFPVVSLDFVKVSRVKPSHNAVDLNIFRYVNWSMQC